MAETLSGVNGEILRWAREFYNMNAEDAAKAIGVDVERYCNWEAGTDHPTYAKLRKISEVFRKPSAVFFFPTPPQLPPIKGDLRTLPDDVVNRFSKNIIIQFEKAKVYQMSLKELYSDRESIFMHKDAFPADATALCDYFRTALAFPIAAQKARKSTKVVFEIYREKFYDLGIYVFKEASVYKGYKRDKIEMRGDRAEISDFPLYLNTVAGGLDRRDQTIGGFSFVVKIYALPVVEIIGQLLYLLGRYGFNAQFGDCL